MNFDEIAYVTADGLKKMQDELAYLMNERSAEISQKLETAVAEGELNANTRYLDAKKEQAIVTARITQLTEMLRYAVVVEEAGPKDAVRVGSKVQVAEEGWDEVEEYRIVSALEAEPSAGLISNKSPLGSALLGARIGDIVAALTPGGEAHFRVLAIA